MKRDVVINAENVSMRYRLTSEKIDSLKTYFIKRVKKEITYEEFYALKDINLNIYKGEVVGVLGLNGAGKSTLFKLLAGIMKPTSGSINRVGRIAPLIELGAGFNPDLSGYENIYLNGLVLGYSRKFIESKVEEIEEFCELGRFMYTPLKNYSSGMKARLAFAIATLVKPDILIVDEVLSVGDFKFKEKSGKVIDSMIKEGVTVLIASHSISTIQSLCTRAIWLEKGVLKGIGDVNEICLQYKNS